MLRLRIRSAECHSEAISHATCHSEARSAEESLESVVELPKLNGKTKLHIDEIVRKLYDYL